MFLMLTTLRDKYHYNNHFIEEKTNFERLNHMANV